MEVTVNIPENVYKNVSKLAKRTRRRVDEIILDSLLTDFSVESVGNDQVVTNWSDEEVLALANLELPLKQNKRLTLLLETQRENKLTMNEKIELEGLMGLYNLANIRKSQGIVESVRRKLINSPNDLK